MFIGVEPNHAGLIEASRTARQGKGSLPNLAFVLGSLEQLPGPFAGRADSVSVLFPWGSLLRAVLAPEHAALDALRGLCRPGGTIEVVTAIDPEADCGELVRLGVEQFSFEGTLGAWCAAGFDVTFEALPADHAYQTTWWRKIRQREARQAVRITARPR